MRGLRISVYLLSVGGAGLFSTVSFPLPAQPAVVEWSAVAKITNGTCGDGAVANVVERRGNIHLKLVYPNGQQYAELDVALATDGSGKADFKGNAGAATKLEIPPGTGKRAIKTAQVAGKCQWSWTPK